MPATNTPAVQGLVEFAKTRGYATREFNPFVGVSNPVPPAAAVNLYTPEELIKLLTTAESTVAGRKLVPLICITAFCGVRHGEMNEEKIEALDWAEADLKHRSICVQIGAAKTGKDRTVEIPENLAAWLAPYLRPRGKMCNVSNRSNAICRLRKKAGMEGKKNALRKSFISYQLALTRNIEAVGTGRQQRRGDSEELQAIRFPEGDGVGMVQDHAADLMPLFPDWSGSPPKAGGRQRGQTPARVTNKPRKDWCAL